MKEAKPERPNIGQGANGSIVDWLLAIDFDARKTS